MSEPSELSLKEIHAYFLRNNYKVTNTQLVKHFRKFLTGAQISEARKQFKTYVNILATIKSEGSEKYLILRKKYYNEIPSEDAASSASCMSPVSVSNMSISSDFGDSPSRQPPPYRLPPQFPSTPPSGSINQPVPASMTTVGLPILEPQTKVQYKECVNEFQQAMTNFMDSNRIDVATRKNSFEQIIEEQQTPPSLPPRKRSSMDHRSISRENSVEQSTADNKENIQVEPAPAAVESDENKLSVKEAMMKFNRFASEEEAKIPSPLSKAAKKLEKTYDDTTGSSESLSSHPKAKEWILAAARANYQELAKLASEHPQLVKLQDPNTGYTALHWAAKHGNENIIKLIAGSLKADVNSRTNGGYTALHISMQFGRNDIFELLCNVYKADRDIFDWSGKKPLDYQKQLTTISSSTFSKIKSRKKQHSEKDNSFLRIGSLRIGNLLGVNAKLPPSHHHQQIRSSMPAAASFDMKLHKNWGSADNVLPDEGVMGPPKFGSKKRRQKRDIPDFPLPECHSMPTTPHFQGRHKSNDANEHDSDMAYGFDTNWGA